MSAPHLRGDSRCFRFSVAKAYDFDAIPARLARKQRLTEAFAILCDHCIGGGQDVPGRAEVLFQLDLGCTGEVPGETPDILQIRSSPAIDRLIIIADRE